MTFATLQYSGIERPLADWGISEAKREVSNQASDHFACDIMIAADTSPDPIPYGGQIILRIGRQSNAGPNGNGTSLSGLPLPGLASFTSGQTWFTGWRVENVRSASPEVEKLSYKFAGPWEFFFERLVFQKLWWTWNGTANVADWRSQVILGQSVNALVGVNDTVPGTNATNLMSIAQQIREIVAYVMTQTAADYGSPQIQLDGITAGSDAIYRPNWDTAGNYKLYTSLSGSTLLISDFIAGTYVTSAPANPTSVNTLLTANAPGTAALANAVLRAPLDSVNDITCAEAMRKMLRWIGPVGDPVVWFDYTTTPPTLHVATRDILPSTSLPSFPSQTLKIKRRDDLLPTAVDLKFRVTGTWNGNQYTQVIHDVAGTIGGTAYEGIGLPGALYTASTFAGASPALVGGAAGNATVLALQAAGRDFAAISQTIDMEGANSNLATCAIVTLPVALTTPAGGGSALAFWQAVFPELADITSPDFPTGAPAVTVVDDSGNPVTTSGSGSFQYLLTRGQVAPWMLNGNAPGGTGCQSKKCVITATFTGTENNTTNVSGTPTAVPTGHAQSHPKHATVTLVTIPGGAYTKQYLTPGEIVPYGLAGLIYNLASIPQYEGAFTIQETDITDQCPMGHNLNLTGSLAEWSNMAGCVQQISYDITQGKTTLTFGPAAHLGAKDFVERIRINRGPRWYNLNGNNVQNDPSQAKATQLGSDVAQFGPTHGPPAKDLQIFPTSVADIAANSSSYAAGVPGVALDSRITGQPSYGGLGAPDAPCLHLALGASGTAGPFIRHDANGAINIQGAPAAQTTSNTWIRISLADLAALASADQIYLQELPECDIISGVPTNGYRIYLCGKFSTTPLL